MSLIDEKVLAFIRGSENRTLTFLEIATAVMCAPITARRSVQRLKASGKLRTDTPPGRAFRFILTDEEQSS